MSYHLGERAIEHAVAPWCEAHNLAVVAYSPFGQDAFPGLRSPGGQVLASIADAHGVTPRQVALAFLTRDAPMLVIPKASRQDHVVDNAAAGDLELTMDEISRLDRAFARGPRPRHLPML
jgi:diketogulonate reductase-like aldo/keto reductase